MPVLTRVDGPGDTAVLIPLLDDAESELRPSVLRLEIINLYESGLSYVGMSGGLL